ncbi:MAG: hypothetical protein WBA57_14950 [Elainellaceae cyanobacterium]
MPMPFPLSIAVLAIAFMHPADGHHLECGVNNHTSVNVGRSHVHLFT